MKITSFKHQISFEGKDYVRFYKEGKIDWVLMVHPDLKTEAFGIPETVSDEEHNRLEEEFKRLDLMKIPRMNSEENQPPCLLSARTATNTKMEAKLNVLDRLEGQIGAAVKSAFEKTRQSGNTTNLVRISETSGGCVIVGCHRHKEAVKEKHPEAVVMTLNDLKKEVPKGPLFFDNSAVITLIRDMKTKLETAENTKTK